MVDHGEVSGTEAPGDVLPLLMGQDDDGIEGVNMIEQRQERHLDRILGPVGPRCVAVVDHRDLARAGVSDGKQSVILPQVTFGIAVRMAVMSIIAGNSA